MRAGKMDRTIRIDRFDSGAVNEYGTPTPAFTPLATLRAQLIEASTEEFLQAQGAVDRTAIIFRTRWLQGVTTSDRVHYDGSFFNVRETKEIGRRRGLEIRCERSQQ
ncbi:phage head closure protein [Agrobacterium sp. S2/73]|uniref:phage head closure protein n=1 Tax=unclassified Agrobacterium TaxID=2632611 RepID=UPI001ADA33FF|nr:MULTISPECIES: phage head closure protein [unclassified Agrobacterium]MBO9108702.1 phage head closure protein [Agrobacterium sp. S2/73]QXZ73538.1 phage head closure protein [Agrobacterium sp. S7/73]